MRARRLAVVFASFMLLAFAGTLHACSTTPGGPLGLIDRDDAEPPFESGVAPETSMPETSAPEGGADGSAPATDAEAGAPDADAATADERD